MPNGIGLAGVLPLVQVDWLRLFNDVQTRTLSGFFFAFRSSPDERFFSCKIELLPYVLED